MLGGRNDSEWMMSVMENIFVTNLACRLWIKYMLANVFPNVATFQIRGQFPMRSGLCSLLPCLCLRKTTEN